MQLQVAEIERRDLTGRTDPRVRRSRQRVIEAAQQLLAEGGIDAITVPAVAERAGVHKTTVYRNWPESADLLAETLHSLAHTPPAIDTGSLHDDLVAVFTGLATHLQSPPWDRLLPSVIERAAADPNVHAYHGALTRERRDQAVAVVERGIDRHDLPTDTQPIDVIEAIAGPLYYRVLMTKEPVSSADVQILVDRALRWLT